MEERGLSDMLTSLLCRGPSGGLQLDQVKIDQGPCPLVSHRLNDASLHL